MNARKLDRGALEYMARAMQMAQTYPRENMLATIIQETMEPGPLATEGLAEILQDHTTEDVSQHLSDFLVYVIGRAIEKRTFRRKSLYIVGDDREPKTLKLFFGYQFLNIEVSLFSVEELRTSFAWCKQVIKKGVRLAIPKSAYKNIDAWALYRMKLVLDSVVHPQIEALRNNPTLWHDVIRDSETLYLLDGIVRRMEKTHLLLEKEDRFLKAHKAPDCLRRELREKIETARHALWVLHR